MLVTLAWLSMLGLAPDLFLYRLGEFEAMRFLVDRDTHRGVGRQVDHAQRSPVLTQHHRSPVDQRRFRLPTKPGSDGDMDHQRDDQGSLRNSSADLLRLKHLPGLDHGTGGDTRLAI